MSEKLSIVDLHTHTSYSDGTLKPAELIEQAAANDVAVLSITDHDTIDAYKDPTTFEAAKKYGVELVPGIELSAKYEGKSIHVLGLFIDVEDIAINSLITRQNEYRIQYATEVEELLLADGWNISREDFMTNGTTVTKAHIAQAVVEREDNKSRLEETFGTIPSRGAFIETFMNEGQPYYIPRPSISVGESIDAIHAANGVAICAHPVANVYEGMTNAELHEVLEDNDFDGLEAFYYYFDQSKNGIMIDGIDQMTQIAEQHDMFITAGSDHHGPNPHHGCQTELGFKGQPKRPGMDILNKIVAAKDDRQTGATNE